MIIGTAGHIDHGKTALVKALTGVDGDRLKEEKARGITIDLGFAYLPLPGGESLGFVDVPGHERFIHTMLAGATGIDCALLVIAADDGIKPQTLEHLAIIDLLGIGRGLVALTKADLVSTDRRAAVTAAIREALAGTVLEGADILPVSAVTGLGIDSLRDRLTTLAAAPSSREAAARFRLAIDRVFTLPGIGVVATGTVLSGWVQPGDRVLISPSGLPARVRSLHAQNRPALLGRAGDRCALNLVGADITKDTLHRGDIVLDPALHAPTDRIEASLRLLPGEAKPVGQWFPVRLHHAAAETGARIVLLQDAPILPGASADVQIVLDRPLAACSLDRYVVRDASAQRTIGGGQFIDLRPPARGRRAPDRALQRAALAIPGAAAAFTQLLATPPFIADLAVFACDRALTAAETAALAESLELVLLEADGMTIAFTPGRWQMFITDVMAQLASHHEANPDLQGVGRDRLRLLLQPRLPARVFVTALQMMAAGSEIVLAGAFVRLASHHVRLTPADAAAWEGIAPLLAGAERFRPPRVRDIARLCAQPEPDIRRLLKLIGRMGLADEVAQDHFFLRGTVDEMVRIARDVGRQTEDGFFTAAQFRDQLLNGRKVAIQILEFFDRHGVTQRQGDLRRINAHRLDLFGTFGHASAHGGASSPVGRSDFKSEWGSEPVLGGFDSRSPPPALRTILS